MCMRAAALLLVATLGLGCTTSLSVQKVGSGEASSITGPIYHLPMVEMEVAVTRRLKECRVVVERRQHVVSVKMAAEVTLNYLPDMENTYFIDYEELVKATKNVSNFQVKLRENGTLQSINADIEDRTSQIVSDTVTGALGLARAAVLPVQVPTAAETEPLCNENAISAIDNLEEVERLISHKETEIERLEQSMAEPATEETRNRLTQLRQELLQSKDKKKTLTALIADKQIYTLSTDAASMSGPLYPSSRLLAKWFNSSVLEDLVKSASDPEQVEIEWTLAGMETCQSGSPPECVGTPKSLVAHVSVLFEETNLTVHEDLDGLVYRQPAKGKLLMCQGDSCLDDKGQVVVAAKDRILTEDIDVPQAGIKASLPLKNRAFQNNAITVEFYESGAIKLFEFKSTAAGEKAAAAFSSNADKLAEFLEARRRSDVTELEAEAERVKAEIELEKARDELELLLTD